MFFETQNNHPHPSIRSSLAEQTDSEELTEMDLSDCLFYRESMTETLITFLQSAALCADSTGGIDFEISEDDLMIEVSHDGRPCKFIDCSVSKLQDELVLSVMPLFQKPCLDFFNRFKATNTRQFEAGFDKDEIGKIIPNSLANWHKGQSEKKSFKLFWQTHDALLITTASLSRMVKESGVKWFKDVSFNPFLWIDERAGFMLTVNSQRPLREKKYWFFEYSWTGLEKWYEFCQVLWFYTENFGQHDGLGPYPDSIKMSPSAKRYTERAAKLNITPIFTGKEIRLMRFVAGRIDRMDVDYANFDEVWRVGLLLRILERNQSANMGAMPSLKRAYELAGELINDSTIAS